MAKRDHRRIELAENCSMESSFSENDSFRFSLKELVFVVAGCCLAFSAITPGGFYVVLALVDIAFLSLLVGKLAHFLGLLKTGLVELDWLELAIVAAFVTMVNVVFAWPAIT